MLTFSEFITEAKEERRRWTGHVHQNTKGNWEAHYGTRRIGTYKSEDEAKKGLAVDQATKKKNDQEMMNKWKKMLGK